MWLGAADHEAAIFNTGSLPPVSPCCLQMISRVVGDKVDKRVRQAQQLLLPPASAAAQHHQQQQMQQQQQQQQMQMQQMAAAAAAASSGTPAGMRGMAAGLPPLKQGARGVWRERAGGGPEAGHSCTAAAWDVRLNAA